MASGPDDSNAPQLSDIMAAFDIPDAAVNYSQQYQPTRSSLPTPPSENLGSSAVNDNIKASSLLSSIASMAMSSAMSLEHTSQSHQSVPHHSRVHQSVPQQSHVHQSVAQQPHANQSPQNQSIRGHQSFTQQPASVPPAAAGFVGMSSPTTYVVTTPKTFRHQHEAAVECDTEQFAGPMLVYSKEDWPSPDCVGSKQDHISASSPVAAASRPPQCPEVVTAPSKAEGSIEPDYSHGAGSESHQDCPESVGPQHQPNIQRNLRKKRAKGEKRPAFEEMQNEESDREKEKEADMSFEAFKPFRSVMTSDHRRLISNGLSQDGMIALMGELQEMLRAKQAEAKRIRRASWSEDQIEEERRRNRERKRRSRENPFIEFRHIMTDEQRRQLTQPDLDPQKRNFIMMELQAVRKWINREQKRARRAQMSDEQREEERRKSREYKRRARSNPLQTFRSVLTEKHYELLGQDLDQEQRENLVQELIELKKTKQRDEMRTRRANFSTEQREQERMYSREYKRVQRQKDFLSDNYGLQGTESFSSDTASVDERIHQVQQSGQLEAMQIPNVSASRTESPSFTEVHKIEPSSNLMVEDRSVSKFDSQKLRNRDRQRRRRAMQTETEKEEERRKNRERSRMRRMKLADIAQAVAMGKLQSDDAMNNHPSLHNHPLPIVQRASRFYNYPPDIEIKTEATATCNDGQIINQIATTPLFIAAQNETPPADVQAMSPLPNPATWLTKQMLEGIKRKNRECTQRVRANMTAEQRERERERNRERQQLRRLRQTPEERVAYMEKQRNERRRQRQDPAYREREREMQRQRKKHLRESPFYRAHEMEMHHLRKSRRSVSYVRSYQEDDNDGGYGGLKEEDACSNENYLDGSDTSGEYDDFDAELDDELNDGEQMSSDISDDVDEINYQTEVSSNQGIAEIVSDANALKQNHEMRKSSVGCSNSAESADLANKAEGKGIVREDMVQGDEEPIGKIASSIFGMHRITPLTQS